MNTRSIWLIVYAYSAAVTNTGQQLFIFNKTDVEMSRLTMLDVELTVMLPISSDIIDIVHL